MPTPQLQTMAECLRILNKAIASQQAHTTLFIHHEFEVNQNCRVFFTMTEVSSLPLELSRTFKPVWMCTPSAK
jgi:hypothetical protein